MRTLSPLSTEWISPRKAFWPTFMTGDVFEDADQLFDNLIKPSYTQLPNAFSACDITESQDHYLVSLDIPGVKKEDLKIEVQANSLLISGERHGYGKFERTFELSNSINAEKIEAHHENGVLNIALPKIEAAKPKTIQIQSGEPSFFSKLLGSKKENQKELKDVKVS